MSQASFSTSLWASGVRGVVKPSTYRLFLLGTLLCSLLTAAGCDYRFAGRGDGLQPLQGKTIAIPLFVSKGYRPGLESMLTESVIQEFALRSGGRVVAVEDDSVDLLVNGTVTSFTTSPVSYSASDKIKEYRVQLAVTVDLRERSSHRILRQASMVESQDYPVETDVALQLNREKAAIREICRKLAQRIFVKSWEDF